MSESSCRPKLGVYPMRSLYVFPGLPLSPNRVSGAVSGLHHPDRRIYPREILKEALARNASALIVAHNHSSGNPIPSEADQNLTQTLKNALQLVDIPLLDHCIVSGSGFFSFSDAGLMKIGDK